MGYLDGRLGTETVDIEPSKLPASNLQPRSAKTYGSASSSVLAYCGVQNQQPLKAARVDIIVWYIASLGRRASRSQGPLACFCGSEDVGAG
eukprot:scaffold68045_cov17-Prasinocladus_malaysianus.AAC.1